MIDTKTLLASLSHFHGTEKYYRGIVPGTCYTDGVYAMAKIAECFWLIDLCLSHMTKQVRRGIDGFGQWTITTDQGATTATLCRDTGEPPLAMQVVASSSLPDGVIRLFIAEGGPGGALVLMLPSEY